MLRILGGLLLMGGMSALGFSAAGRLARRVHHLEALLWSLEQMQREMTFRLPFLPELLRRLEVSAPAPANELFRLCIEGMEQLGEASFAELWHNSIRQTPLDLTTEETSVLEVLGGALGRYDAQGQAEALEQTCGELRQVLVRARKDRARLSRMYQVLGVTAGMLVVILLL